MRVVNDGPVRSASVGKSAGQSTFQREVPAPEFGLNGFHTAEVGGSRPSSPTTPAPNGALNKSPGVRRASTASGLIDMAVSGVVAGQRPLL